MTGPSWLCCGFIVCALRRGRHLHMQKKKNPASVSCPSNPTLGKEYLGLELDQTVLFHLLDDNVPGQDVFMHPFGS